MAAAQRPHASRHRSASVEDAPAAADLRLRPSPGLQHPHDAGADPLCCSRRLCRQYAPPVFRILMLVWMACSEVSARVCMYALDN